MRPPLLTMHQGFIIAFFAGVMTAATCFTSTSGAAVTPSRASAPHTPQDALNQLFGSRNIGAFNGGSGNTGAFNGNGNTGTNDGTHNVGAFNGNNNGGSNNGNGNTGAFNGNNNGQGNTP